MTVPIGGQRSTLDAALERIASLNQAVAARDALQQVQRATMARLRAENAKAAR